MKRLLLDQNLSPRLVDLLDDLFPGSKHVSGVDLDTATDEAVWLFARENGFIITPKDADFTELGIVRGFPPKVLWIRRGNCSTKDIEALIRENYASIIDLGEDAETGVLALL
jgi:predicted nuclease of predicted toxin-antitoxin system